MTRTLVRSLFALLLLGCATTALANIDALLLYADAQASPGGELSYLIYVDGYAYPRAPGTITIHLPAGVTFKRTTPVAGADCTSWTTPSGSGGDVVCSTYLGFISTDIVVTVNNSVTPGTTLTATAKFDFGTLGGEIQSSSTSVVAPATITLGASTASTPKAGAAYPLKVKITNTSNSTAYVPWVTIKRSSRTGRFAPPTNANWSCGVYSDPSVMSCELPSGIAPGTSTEETIQPYAPPDGSSDSIEVTTELLNTTAPRLIVSNFNTSLDNTAVLTAISYEPYPAVRTGYAYNIGMYLNTDGPSLSNVTFSYDTPANTVVLGVTMAGGATCTAPPAGSGGHVACSVASVPGATHIGESAGLGGTAVYLSLRSDGTSPITHKGTFTAANATAPATATLTLTPAVNVITVTPRLDVTGSLGEMGTLQLTLSNVSPLDAENVTVDFNFPPGIAFQGPTSSTAVCTGLHCTLGTIRSLSSSRESFKIQLPDTAGTYPISAVVNGTAVIPATATTNLTLYVPELTISLSASPSRLMVGEDASLTVAVKNTGTDATSWPLQITVVPPAGMQIHNIIGGSGCSLTSQLTCVDSARLFPGHSWTIGFAGRAGQTPGVATITASATSGKVASNVASATITVTQPVAVLTSSLTADRKAVPSGERLVYTLKVANSGPDAASTVLADLQSIGDAGITTVDSNGFLNCSVQRPFVHCSVPLLLAGASASVNVTVTAPASEGTLSATSTVTSQNTTALTSALTTSVVALGPADVVVQPAVSGQNTIPGGTIVTRFTIANVGASAASGVLFDASLSSGLTLKSVTSTRGSCVATHCELGGLGVGVAAEVSVTAVAARAGGEFVRGSASTTSAQSSTTNDSAQTAITVAATRSRAARH